MVAPKTLNRDGRCHSRNSKPSCTRHKWKETLRLQPICSYIIELQTYDAEPFAVRGCCATRVVGCHVRTTSQGSATSAAADASTTARAAEAWNFANTTFCVLKWPILILAACSKWTIGWWKINNCVSFVLGELYFGFEECDLDFEDHMTVVSFEQVICFLKEICHLIKRVNFLKCLWLMTTWMI
jgi:hypothetical protein